MILLQLVKIAIHLIIDNAVYEDKNLLWKLVQEQETYSSSNKNDFVNSV